MLPRERQGFETDRSTVHQPFRSDQIDGFQTSDFPYQTRPKDAAVHLFDLSVLEGNCFNLWKSVDCSDREGWSIHSTYLYQGAITAMCGDQLRARAVKAGGWRHARQGLNRTSLKPQCPNSKIQLNRKSSNPIAQRPKPQSPPPKTVPNARILKPKCPQPKI